MTASTMLSLSPMVYHRGTRPCAVDLYFAPNGKPRPILLAEFSPYVDHRRQPLQAYLMGDRSARFRVEDDDLIATDPWEISADTQDLARALVTNEFASVPAYRTSMDVVHFLERAMDRFRPNLTPDDIIPALELSRSWSEQSPLDERQDAWREIFTLVRHAGPDCVRNATAIFLLRMGMSVEAALTSEITLREATAMYAGFRRMTG